MKNKLKIICILIIVMFLCGCGNKKIITADKFYSTYSSLNYSLNDVTSQIEDKNIKRIITANNRKYQIEYFEFDTINNAKQAFNNNKKDFVFISENYKYVEKNNYEKFIQETDSKYNYIVRVDNTLIYCSSNIEYKEQVKKDIKKIGY